MVKARHHCTGCWPLEPMPTVVVVRIRIVPLEEPNQFIREISHTAQERYERHGWSNCSHVFRNDQKEENRWSRNKHRTYNLTSSITSTHLHYQKSTRVPGYQHRRGKMACVEYGIPAPCSKHRNQQLIALETREVQVKPCRPQTPPAHTISRFECAALSECNARSTFRNVITQPQK